MDVYGCSYFGNKQESEKEILERIETVVKEWKLNPTNALIGALEQYVNYEFTDLTKKKLSKIKSLQT